MNSGVFHGGWGESGVIRFSPTGFESSVDGGRTFSALGGGVGSPVSLQEAYETGRAIDTSTAEGGEVQIAGARANWRHAHVCQPVHL
jgi:hypothetical protein